MQSDISRRPTFQAPGKSYFQLAGEQERAGRWDKALRILASALLDPTRDAMRVAVDMSIQRILHTCALRAAAATFPVEAVYENTKNPRKVASDGRRQPSDIVISLTTISSRLDHVGRTLECIAKQTIQPHSVNLYISEDPYLLDKGIDRRDDALRKIADLGVNIYMTPNIGPYRKQYPVVRQLRSAGASPHTIVMTIDDDVLYPSDVVERLANAAEYSNAVVAHRGRKIALSGDRLQPYASFGPPTEITDHLNLATGKNGIAYRLQHFPEDPAEYVGPYLAPTADDIWCKWITGIRCVPTAIIEPRAAYDPKLDFPESAPSNKYGLFHAFNAKGTNDDAMLNMEAFFLFRRGVNLSTIYAIKKR